MLVINRPYFEYIYFEKGQVTALNKGSIILIFDQCIDNFCCRSKINVLGVLHNRLADPVKFCLQGDCEVV